MSNLRTITLGLLLICCAVLSSQQTSGFSDENHEFTCSADSGIPLQECEALVALYESTDGPNWRTDTGWLLHTNPCIWYGVTCAIGHVRNLELSGTSSEDGSEVNHFGLNGPIPAEIGNLSQLDRLDLSHNQLESLPAEIGQFAELDIFDLSYNQLITLPVEIGTIANLSYMDVSHNQLENLPDEIGNLTYLGELNASYNQLSSLPAEAMGDLEYLSTLNLSHNQFAILTATIGSLVVNGLDLSHNQLEMLPAEVGNITALVGLHLSNNRLTSLPVEIGALKRLSTLRLNDNQLSELPEELGSLTDIEYLDLDHNQLSALPATLWNFTKLYELDLSHNQFNLLPAEISNLTALTNLDLSYNQLRTLPTSLANLELGGELDLGYNHLLTTDETLLDWMNTEDYDWADTQFLDESTPVPTREPTPTPAETPTTTMTPVPNFACSNVSEISEAECAGLVAFYESTDGPNWQQQSGWLVTNMPCSWYGITCREGHVVELILNGTQGTDFGLAGAVPAEIGDLTHLIALDINDNQLRTLPDTISNLANLERFDLHNNQLDTLPAEIGALANLRSLDLSANQLNSLPAEIGQLTNLWYLWLDANRLETLPMEIGDLVHLKKLDVSANPLITLPASLINLTQLSDLALGNHRLQITDDALLAWLNEYFPNWLDTQSSATHTPTPAYTATHTMTPTAIGTTPRACKGITWVYKKQIDEYTLVGRHSETNAYSGDTDCSESWPLLCLKKESNPVPDVLADELDYYGGWTGGQIGLTQSISGYELTSLDIANDICASQLGEGWRFGEFHDGNGGWNWWAEGEVPVDVYFWLWIDDQPANPWNYLRPLDPIPISAPLAETSTPVPDAPAGGESTSAPTLTATPTPIAEDAKLTAVPDDGAIGTATSVPSSDRDDEPDVTANATGHNFYLPTIRD